MDTNRKLWNNGQQKLRRALASNDYREAIDQFSIQHAMVHSNKVSGMEVWSFEDEIWRDLTDKDFRAIPPKEEHSIAWILFHIARIEDIVSNVLMVGTPQLYTREKWAKKLKSTIHHSANKMDDESVARFSASLDMTALQKYRSAVGCRTREIVRQIKAEEFDQRVDPVRLQKVLDEGAVIPEAMEVINYWSKRTIAGLLLMPLTRHNFLHLNEAMMVRSKFK